MATTFKASPSNVDEPLSAEEAVAAAPPESKNVVALIASLRAELATSPPGEPLTGARLERVQLRLFFSFLFFPFFFFFFAVVDSI